MCGVEDAEEVEDGVVDVSCTQEGQTPGGPHQAGDTHHGEAAPAGVTEPHRVPLSRCLGPCRGPRAAPGHPFHVADLRGHCDQNASVEDEYEGEIHQVQGVEEGVICDPAAVVQMGQSFTDNSGGHAEERTNITVNE